MKGTATAMAKASYEVETIPQNVGPIHKRLLSYFNEMHEARDTGNIDVMEDLESIVPALLGEFEAVECSKGVNPGWLLNKMRAGWEVARGDFEAALKFERDGYRCAEDEPTDGNNIARNQRLSISASNIADELWRLDRATEGLPWAKLSVDLWPSNTVNSLVLAITAYHAGFPNEADQLLSQLRRIANFDDARDVLSKCMQFERELHTMTDLASVQGLFEDMGVK